MDTPEKSPLPRPQRGIVPPMVTPLADRDRLDLDGLARLIEHNLGGGVHGLFILGTTGEAPSLGYRLRRELVERTCRLVAGRVPVLVGITDTAFGLPIGLVGNASSRMGKRWLSPFTSTHGRRSVRPGERWYNSPRSGAKSLDRAPT